MLKEIRSHWSEEEAARFIERHAPRWGEDVALRTYSSRLIGEEASLVLHGGGNTSVKTVVGNILGEQCRALYVKGSGWDLATIEPEGHPAVHLDHLNRLRSLSSMTDEVMVNELRTHLFDATSPTPSVEALLHAFIPDKFIDHSHADSILALTNNERGEELVQECFGDDVVVVPYIMPGFALAKMAADLYDATPGKSGMVLLKHGLFSFGATARESYERHLELVNRATKYLSGVIAKAKRPSVEVASPHSVQEDIVVPILRGLCALRDGERVTRRWILTSRCGAEMRNFADRSDARLLSSTPPLTPDHIIRTKAAPLYFDIGDAVSEEEVRARCDSLLKTFAGEYCAYFDRAVHARKVERTRLDCVPRIVVIPGYGVIAIGEDANAARIAADIYEHTVRVKGEVSRFDSYCGLPELDLFDMEYWSLEQAKLGKGSPKPLRGKVALITGGTGAIGSGIARVLKGAGAAVVITDIARVSEVSAALGVDGIEMDVTSESSQRAAFSEVVRRYGGVDIVVPNAGIAISRPIEKLTADDAERVMQVNFTGYLLTVKVAAEIMKRQGTGGDIVIVSSKNVLAPGKEFSLYSASKAAGHQLGKIAALELAPHQIRVNMVAPDAVFGGGVSESGLWKEVGPERAKSRGLEFSELEEFYRQRNLLRTRITGEDVGRAVLFFATEQTPTTGATLPVDGGIAEAFPR